MWPVEIYGQTTVSNELCSSESKSYIEYSLFIGLTVCEHLLFSEVKWWHIYAQQDFFPQQ